MKFSCLQPNLKNDKEKYQTEFRKKFNKPQKHAVKNDPSEIYAISDQDRAEPLLYGMKWNKFTRPNIIE